MNTNIVTSAIIRAIEAHGKQTRKGVGGEPYVIHPIRVMSHIELDEHGIFFVNVNKIVLASACLHDVLEDTSHTIDDFPLTVHNLVDLMTKTEGEDKIAAIKKIGDNDQALLIKLADRYDNCFYGDEEIRKEYCGRNSVIESTKLLLTKCKPYGLQTTKMFKELDREFNDE